MKRISVRITCLLLVLFLIIPSLAANASASAYSDGLPDLSGAESVYFANLDSGKLLAKKDAGGRIAPASTVKIMTGLIAIEHFKDSPDSLVTVTDAMLSAASGTSMRLAAGDVLTAYDLIYGVLCGGFNDAAHVLAHAVSGSAGAFVKLMNDTAKELGMTDTNYVNPTGYDSSAAYTTLNDVVILAKNAAENETYIEISSAPSKRVSFENGKEDFLMNNRNALISSYYAYGYVSRYANGIIAGMTDLGGYCVITAPKINDASYLCIVMGAGEQDGNILSFDIAYKLISYAQSNLGFLSLMDAETKICELPVDFALEGSDDDGEYKVSVYTAAEAKAFLPIYTDTESEITYKYYLYSERLTAPLTSDTWVGGIDFYFEGEIVATVPLVVGKDVDANTFAISMDKAKKFITSRTFIISAVSFAVLFGIWFYFFDYKARRRKANRIRYRNY